MCTIIYIYMYSYIYIYTQHSNVINVNNMQYRITKKPMSPSRVPFTSEKQLWECFIPSLVENRQDLCKHIKEDNAPHVASSWVNFWGDQTSRGLSAAELLYRPKRWGKLWGRKFVQLWTFPWIFFKMEIPKKKRLYHFKEKPMFAYVVAIFLGGGADFPILGQCGSPFRSEEDFKQLLCDQPEDSAAGSPSSPVAANMNRP